MKPDPALERACAVNPAFKKLVGIIEAHKARTGRQLDAIYISDATNAQLPLGLKLSTYRPEFRLWDIPVRLHVVLPPEGHRG